MLTDNSPDSVYVILFDFSNAAPKFNVLDNVSFGWDAWWFVLFFCISFLAFPIWLRHKIYILSLSITEVAIGDDGDLIEAWKEVNRRTKPVWVEMFRWDGSIHL